MLHLKRKAGHSVRIQHQLIVTVCRLDEAEIFLKVTRPGIEDRVLRAVIGQTVTLHTLPEHAAVKITLSGIRSGEAALAFDAPQNIQIDRLEKLTL